MINSTNHVLCSTFSRAVEPVSGCNSVPDVKHRRKNAQEAGLMSENIPWFQISQGTRSLMKFSEVRTWISPCLVLCRAGAASDARATSRLWPAAPRLKAEKLEPRAQEAQKANLPKITASPSRREVLSSSTGRGS